MPCSDMMHPGRRGIMIAMTAFLLLVNFEFVHPARHSTIGLENQRHHSWEGETIKEFEDWIQEIGSQARTEAELPVTETFAPDRVANASSSHRQLAGSQVFVVDQNGKGHFRSVQAAVNAVPEGNRATVVILIHAGVYKEKVFIPHTKPFIKFQGAGRDLSVIQSSGNAKSSGGTAESATVYVNADNFIAADVGFRNSAPAPSSGSQNQQAVALLLNGDKHAFYRCGVYGAQDTLFDYVGRHYFSDCFIQGSIDFICGNGRTLFVKCELHSISKVQGSLTAQKRSSPEENTGFIFVNCKITGTGPVYLGRAWGGYSRVVYMYTYMEDIVIPAGWYDWGQSSRQRTVFYGQYQCSGPGSNQAHRVPWSHELSARQATPLGQITFIDGTEWLRST